MVRIQSPLLPDVLSPEEAGRRSPAALEKLRQWRPEVTGSLALPRFDGAMTAAAASNSVAAAWLVPDLATRLDVLRAALGPPPGGTPGAAVSRVLTEPSFRSAAREDRRAATGRRPAQRRSSRMSQRTRRSARASVGRMRSKPAASNSVVVPTCAALELMRAPSVSTG